jgi:hypothetical protein
MKKVPRDRPHTLDHTGQLITGKKATNQFIESNAETRNIHILPDRRKEIHQEPKVYKDQEQMET